MFSPYPAFTQHVTTAQQTKRREKKKNNEEMFLFSFYAQFLRVTGEPLIEESSPTSLLLTKMSIIVQGVLAQKPYLLTFSFM